LLAERFGVLSAENLAGFLAADREKLAEHTVRCELFSTKFPSNREKYREMRALVDGIAGETPIQKGFPRGKWDLSEIGTGI
jgi:hypothetical protein